MLVKLIYSNLFIQFVKCQKWHGKLKVLKFEDIFSNSTILKIYENGILKNLALGKQFRVEKTNNLDKSNCIL